jgi:hypothetical protein
MAEDVREKRSSTTSGRSKSTTGRTDHATNINDMLTGLGVKPETAQNLKSYVASAVENRVRGVRSEDAMDHVVATAVKVAGKLRNNAKKNPKMFFAGLGAAAVGIGMMVGAGLRAAREGEMASETTRPTRNRGRGVDVTDFEVE